jgi:hypothetical protein
VNDIIEILKGMWYPSKNREEDRKKWSLYY